MNPPNSKVDDKFYYIKTRFPPVIPLKGNKYILYKDFLYHFSCEQGVHFLSVDKGFKTDMASIPRILWWLVSPFDLGHAPIIHDWLYRYGGKIEGGSYHILFHNGKWVEGELIWSRKKVDKLFYYMMKEGGVGRLKRKSAHLIVRLFGWIIFTKNKLRSR